MAILTKKSDVVANFVRYYGRQPKDSDMATIDYLTTKAPKEVESLLAKNSPVTWGKLWSQYNTSKTVTTKPVVSPVTSPVVAPAKMATLYWPNGQPQTVPVGSELASALQTDGWWLTKGSYKAPTVKDTSSWTTGDTWKEKTQSEIDAEAKAASDKAMSDQINWYIDTLGLDESQKIILRQLAKQEAASGTKIYQKEDIDKLLNSASDAAIADTTPYYDKITTQEVEDLKNKMSDIRGQADRYAQTSTVDYKATVAKTQQSLRARGLTFSGIQRKELGAEWAIQSNGVEGAIPEARRMDYSAKQAEFTQSARDAGLAAERKLGSSTVSWLTGSLGSISDPYAWGTTYNPNSTTSLYNPTGTTPKGQFELDKKRDIEKSKWSRINSLNQYL